MDLENHMLSKISQTEKDNSHMIITDMWEIKLKATNEETRHKQIKTQIHRQRNVVTRGEGGGGRQ